MAPVRGENWGRVLTLMSENPRCKKPELSAKSISLDRAKAVPGTPPFVLTLRFRTVFPAMTTADTPTDALADARQLQKELESQFPVLKNASPLAIGIDKQIIAALPEVSRKSLRTALRNHTLSTRYLKSMEKATVRLNLDASEAGEVTAEQREHAAGLLRERFKKQAEQKRASEAAAKAEHQRQEKLSQLAEKFGRKR